MVRLVMVVMVVRPKHEPCTRRTNDWVVGLLLYLPQTYMLAVEVIRPGGSSAWPFG